MEHGQESCTATETSEDCTGETKKIISAETSEDDTSETKKDISTEASEDGTGEKKKTIPAETTTLREAERCFFIIIL